MSHASQSCHHHQKLADGRKEGTSSRSLPGGLVRLTPLFSSIQRLRLFLFKLPNLYSFSKTTLEGNRKKFPRLCSPLSSPASQHHHGLDSIRDQAQHRDLGHKQGALLAPDGRCGSSFILNMSSTGTYSTQAGLVST